MKKYVFHSTEGWKHAKVYTKSSVSKKIPGSLKKRINKEMILWGQLKKFGYIIC
jgi:hypothetical protein